jgi:hypothetical protein
MELQPGLFVHNAAAMRVALEQMRTTLSQEDWTLLRQEMRRIGVGVFCADPSRHPFRMSGRGSEQNHHSTLGFATQNRCCNLLP